MKKNHISDIIPDYLDGLLSEQEYSLASEHLAECEDCRNELSEYEILFKAFDNEEVISPSDRLREQFLQDIEAEKSSMKKTISVLSSSQSSRFSIDNFFKIAASIAIIVGAFFIGRLQQNTVSNTEYAQMVSDNASYKETAMLSLIGNKSASKRIQGVNYINEMIEPDEAIVKALSERMIHDENTNVRRTAVDALSEFTASDLVKESYIEALKSETDPGIQISIIKILGEIREKKAASLMQELLKQENIQPYVKDEMEAVLPNII